MQISHSRDQSNGKLQKKSACQKGPALAEMAGPLIPYYA